MQVLTAWFKRDFIDFIYINKSQNLFYGWFIIKATVIPAITPALLFVCSAPSSAPPLTLENDSKDSSLV